MELRHLRYFVMVGETLNLSRASEGLHVSQPALSRQIRDLEDELGTLLFVRQPSGVELTSAGRLFLRSAREILSKATSAVREVEERRKGAHETFRLGFDHASTSVAFFQGLRRFGLEHPEVDLILGEEEAPCLLRALREQQLDLALISGNQTSLPPEFEYQVISQQTLRVFLEREHALATRNVIPLRELRDDPLIALSEREFPIWNMTVLHACRRAGFEAPLFLRGAGYAAIMGLVAAKRGYAIHPEGACRYIDCDSVVSIPLERPATFSVGAIWTRSSICPPRHQFLESMKANKERTLAILPPKAFPQQS